MKGNVIVALVVGALLGFVLGRATKSAPPPAPVAQVQPAKPVPAKPEARPQAAKPVEDPKAIYKIPVGDSPSTGPASAKVTVVEVTDFQCPYCSRANDTMKQLKEVYGKDLRVVVKQNPLGFHQFAHISAQAALAAHEQGKYWEMHHKMFENQKNGLDRASLEKYAGQLGLDLGRFKAALDSQKFKDQIDAEQKQAVGLGAGGTPSFFVNGRKVVGAQPLERFKQVIDEELKKADAALARGVKAEDLYAELIKNAATRPVMLPGAPAEAAPPPAAPPAANALQKAEVADYSPFKGPKHAKVTIVEWSDFECPYCSRGAAVAEEITKAYPNEVKFVFRHQPLSFHKNAKPAAKAAMAAHLQGKFWPMHDKMFANSKALTTDNFVAWAQELGLDVERFKKDLESPEIERQVSRDAADGMKVGASGTPTFFVNGRKVAGAQPFASFKAIIDEEIKNADVQLAKGVKLADLYQKLTDREAPQVAIGDAPVKGNPNAKVKILEFSEFQCPFCSRVLPTMKQIEETYGDKVAIAFKSFPLGFHQHAQQASEAALAAHEQGKFWPMHDLLFENQKALDRASLEGYAQKLGLDMTKFKAALDSGKFRAQIQRETAEGASVGISGTPSFLVNGRLVVGAKGFDEFKAIIDEELAK